MEELFEPGTEEALIDKQNNALNEPDSEVPEQYEPEWHDYVMSHFLEDELFNGNPTVDGMRRVTNKLIGKIYNISSNVVQAPDNNNGNRATVVVTVSLFNYSADESEQYSGAADAFNGNVEGEYAKFPVSIAETRAEGRAFKRALKLRKVNAAEEMPMVNSSAAIQPGKITDTQINFMDLLCNASRCNINIKKLVEKYCAENDLECNNIRKLTHEQSLALLKMINDYQRDMSAIPSELIGYDFNWRQVFA